MMNDFYFSVLYGSVKNIPKILKNHYIALPQRFKWLLKSGQIHRARHPHADAQHAAFV